MTYDNRGRSPNQDDRFAFGSLSAGHSGPSGVVSGSISFDGVEISLKVDRRGSAAKNAVWLEGVDGFRNYVSMNLVDGVFIIPRSHNAIG